MVMAMYLWLEESTDVSACFSKHQNSWHGILLTCGIAPIVFFQESLRSEIVSHWLQVGLVRYKF